MDRKEARGPKTNCSRATSYHVTPAILFTVTGSKHVAYQYNTVTWIINQCRETARRIRH